MENIKSFITEINSGDTVDITEFQNTLEHTITKELTFNDVYSKLIASKQDTIKVKEIVLESEVDFISSAKYLKTVFETQLKEAIDKVNDLYNRELLSLQTFYRNKLAGEGLMNLIKVLNENDYSIVIMNSRIYAYRYYKPEHQVCEGHFQSGTIYDYHERVCNLKGVYVNLLHPKITNGSVMISTDDRHPNANGSGLSEVCVGNLDGRLIPLENTEALVDLLNEICETYEVMHLDSAYFIPEGEYTVKEVKIKWTA